MRKELLILIAAAGLVAFEKADAQAAPQQALSPDDPTSDSGASSSSSASSSAAGHRPEVIITGQRELENRITLFVNQLTDFDLGDPGRGLARWQDSLCPLVSGAPREQGEYILERVTEIAQQAGAPLAGRHCHANLFILVSSEPQAVLRDLEKRHRAEVFGDAEPNVVETFIATSRPVRTWYDTVQRTPEGMPILKMSFPGISDMKVVAVSGGTVKIPVAPNQPDSFGANPWSEASHLTLNVVWAMARVFVVVDATRLQGTTLRQLADYAAMAGLAQIKTDARVSGDPTILTLFEGPPQAAPAGLTDWDRAFLKAVYSTEQKSILQRSDIASGIVRTVAPR